MNRLTELIISIVILIITLFVEWSPNTFKIIKSDLKTTTWVLSLLAIALFCIGLSLYKEDDKEHKQRLIESLKKAIMAFIIAYLAHLDFTLVPFWLIFIVAFFFHDWV